MKWFFILIGSVLITSCGSSTATDREWVLADGDWGWGDGVFCMNLGDVVRIEGEALTFYVDGEVSATGKILSRSVIHQTGSQGTGGKVDGMTWSYFIKTVGGKTEAYTERFSLRRRDGKPAALLAAPKRTEADLVTKQKKSVTNPRKGQRLSPCPPHLD